MTRCTSALFVTLLITSTAAIAQDREFLRALERAQQQRPDTLAMRARIAPASEPGTPLVIHGRVFDTAGRAPVPGAIVFAYQTDRGGLYDAPGSTPHSWRLRGWARTDAEGRFVFETIRPGAYPGAKIPAHVHFNLFMPNGERYHAGELQFADDELVPPSELAASQRQGEFGHVRPVRTAGGAQHVDLHIRIDPQQRF
jgi:protocatechuate 3,4-dioxygenase beta subunit